MSAKASEQHPDRPAVPPWLYDGATVVVMSGGYFQDTAYKTATVDRVTPTQVIVDGDRYQIRTLRQHGTYRATLADPADPQVAAAVIRWTARQYVADAESKLYRLGRQNLPRTPEQDAEVYRAAAVLLGAAADLLDPQGRDLDPNQHDYQGDHPHGGADDCQGALPGGDLCELDAGHDVHRPGR